MYSSEDLELFRYVRTIKACFQIVERRKSIKRFYFQYRTEAMPKGISIKLFCLRNKVPCTIFSFVPY